MIRHLLRFAVLLAILGAVSLLAAALLEETEPVSIEWNGWILETHFWVAVAALILAFVSGWLAVSLFLGAFRTPGRIHRAWRARRQERGMLALGKAFAAYAAEDGKGALASARRAERLLGDARLTRSVVAKSLELGGHSREASDYYRALAADRATAETGERGLLAAATRSGDVESAVAHARNVIALHPDDQAVHRKLFDLLVRNRRWSDAREALREAVRRRAWTRKEAQVLEACMEGAEAAEAQEAGNLVRARECAQRSAELDPTLSASACLAARLHAMNGNRKQAERVLLAAWRVAPAPDIASAWTDLRPRAENGEAARKHVLRLTDAFPSHPESRLLAAEAAITAHDWSAARAALGDLPASAPTARVCAVMAALEKAGNSNTVAAQLWLARALDAPRGSQWTCPACGCLPGQWEAICPECGAFGRISRRRSLRADGRQSPSAVIPLMDNSQGASGQEPSDSTAQRSTRAMVELPLEEEREPFRRPDA